MIPVHSDSTDFDLSKAVDDTPTDLTRAFLAGTLGMTKADLDAAFPPPPEVDQAQS